MTGRARGPACCRCGPVLCESDDTGDHCATSGCAWCLEGCPAPDNTPCCQNGSSTTQEASRRCAAPRRAPDPMAGRTYLLRGEPVTVVCTFVLPSRARPATPCPPWLHWAAPPPGAPRNAAVRYPDGHIEVRPFRGLRRTTP